MHRTPNQHQQQAIARSQSGKLSYGCRLLAALFLLGGSGTLFAVGDHEASEVEENLGERVSNVVCNFYDGNTDDLLTGGLGATGIANPTPPLPANPFDPTAAELRRLAIYSNYRGIIDTAPGGGFGTFFGPTVSNDGLPGFNSATDGRIAGWECLAYATPRSGRANVTMMVHVPNNFDEDAPCIVAGPASGLRGIYGAIGTSGAWGLKQGCAVAYTDKGAGNGIHDIQNNTVSLINGLREDATVAGRFSNFTAPLSEARRQQFNEESPNRFAFKFMHTRRNSEARWGRDVLKSIRFAFAVLNQDDIGLLRRLRPDNTVVIASSISNGSGASLLAVEADDARLIDGLAGSEPNVNPRLRRRLTIQQGNGPAFTEPGKASYDYTTLRNVYQGCANIAYPFGVLLNLTPPQLGQFVCASLRAKGLLMTETPAQQALEAQAIINDYGFLPEQNPLGPATWALQFIQSGSVSTANAYTRAGVEDGLCGYSFAATHESGVPIPLDPVPSQLLFGVAAGSAPTSFGAPIPGGSIEIINDRSLGGPRLNIASLSNDGIPDQNLDGALCLRSLWTGRDETTGAPLFGRMRALSNRLRASIRQIQASGNLRGTPAILVTGRSDSVIAPNHASRAYFGLNRQVEGSRSQLSYVEVTNAQHGDAFNGFPEVGALFVPLHYYFVQAHNLMYAHLTEGSVLPASQVVRTVPRGILDGAVPPLSAANLPDIDIVPAVDAAIIFHNGVVYIPE